MGNCPSVLRGLSTAGATSTGTRPHWLNRVPAHRHAHPGNAYPGNAHSRNAHPSGKDHADGAHGGAGDVEKDLQETILKLQQQLVEDDAVEITTIGNSSRSNSYRPSMGSLAPMDAMPWGLTLRPDPPAFLLEERAIVRESWQTVEEHIAEIGLTMYLELFRKSPESVGTFNFLKNISKEDKEFYVETSNHAIRVTGILKMLFNLLDLPPDKADAAISEFLLELGRRHFSYGSRTDQMELLGHAFVNSILTIFADRADRAEIRAAWNSYFRVIVFWMQSGFRYVQDRGGVATVADAHSFTTYN